MLEIDGSQYSGSGSIVRLTAAYAALTGTAVHVVNARARRLPKPGLRRQHCTALVAIRELAGGSLDGATVDSHEFTFRPGDETPKGRYCFDIGSAGSTTALGLALVPLLAGRGDGVQVELRDGVFQDFAPPPFHLQQVIAPLLSRMGLDVNFSVDRPGYVPTGEGSSGWRWRRHAVSLPCASKPKPPERRSGCGAWRSRPIWRTGSSAPEWPTPPARRWPAKGSTRPST